MLSEPIITIDVHGMNVEKALDVIHKKVDGAGSAVYEVRVIHGFHGGTRIRSAIREEFGYGLEPKIKRIQPGDNEGITRLILKELF
ncbi:MAG: Smr/MutS family protein [Lachnospiraceae bacterium]|nr:Smr/MutS family protein [Lachnospiraceae bacterium]MCD7766513.1 Smr/MutS family protein [Lachnospiraceae bacterium]